MLLFKRWQVLFVVLLLSPSAAAAQTLLQTMVEAGAWAETFTQFCEMANRAAIANDRAQLAAWAQRNHWAAVQTRLNADPALQSDFNAKRKSFAEEFAAHRFRTTLSCNLLAKELASPAHDPSLQYRSQLQELDGVAASPTLPSSPSAAGPVTFTTPPGWRISQSTAERTVLQTETQHTKAVIFIDQLPFTGDFNNAFATALRARAPVTGLKLQYPHKGVTGAGNPMIEVRDNGTLRGSNQSQAINAVGVGLKDSMVLAVLVSGTWGGENVGFQRVFEKLVSNWKLAKETGPAWDPMHPPDPVGARAGFFVGSRIQNQLNPLGGMDLNAIREYLVLLPTGQAFHGLPLNGHVLDMNFEAECARLPHACGTYRMQGGRIDFIWREEYGMVTHGSSTFEQANGRASVASFNGTSALEVLPARNLKLTGRYTSTRASTGMTAAQSASVVAQTFIQFSADGTYTKSGFSSASFSGSGTGSTVQNRRGIQQGHYTLNGYALTLAPATGEAPETFTTVIEELGPSPKVLFINDSSFLREGR